MKFASLDYLLKLQYFRKGAFKCIVEEKETRYPKELNESPQGHNIDKSNKNQHLTKRK